MFEYLVSKIEFILNKEAAVRDWEGVEAPEFQDERTTSSRRLQSFDEDCRKPRRGLKSQRRTCRKFSNKEYLGRLMKVIKNASSPDRCCTLCMKQKGCVSWTWKPKSSGAGGCYLRKPGYKKTRARKGYWSGYVTDSRQPSSPSPRPSPPPEEPYEAPPAYEAPPSNDPYEAPPSDDWLGDFWNPSPPPPPLPSPSDNYDFGPTDSPNLPPGKTKYRDILDLGWMFYEAQRSGPVPSWNRIKWRGASHLNDKVPGGFYDAGDTLKLNFPLSASMIYAGQGFVEFPNSYSGTSKTNALRVYRIAIQYLYDCLDKNAGTYVGQIGDPKIDHNFWGRPEQANNRRPAYIYKKSMPAADLYGSVSGALAVASIVFKRNGDSAFSSQLLDAALELYSWGDGKPGKYSNYYKDQTKVYKSSGSDDSMAAAAGWLYRATGDSAWLDKALEYWDYKSADVYPCWDSLWSVHAVHMVSLADRGTRVPGEAEYRRYLDDKFYRAWLKADGYQSIVKTPKGMHYPKWNAWANLQFSTTSASLALITAKYTKDAGKRSSLMNYARSQVDYAIGGNGIRSYVIGYGYNYPKFAHHAGASCPNLPAPCGNTQFKSSQPNPQILYGAMVAGPGGVRKNAQKPDEAYWDDRNDYVTNEVAVDYNSGLMTALAGLLDLF